MHHTPTHRARHDHLAPGERSAAWAPAARGGFTLLELLVVLVLVAVSVSMAAPTLRRFVQGRQIDDAGGRFITLAQYARAQAAAEARVYRLLIDARQRTFWLERQRAGTFERLGASTGRTFLLPADIELTWRSRAGADHESAGDLYVIEFAPDGSASDVVFDLTDRHGRTLRLQSLSLASSLTAAAVEDRP